MVGWSNWLEEVELDLICVLNRAAEAAYSVLVSDWPGGRRRGKEGNGTQLIISLLVLQLPAVADKEKHSSGWQKQRRRQVPIRYQSEKATSSEMASRQ